MTEGKRIPRLQVTAQGRLVDEAIIQLVKDFDKPSYKISRSKRVRCGRDTFACTVLTGSENSAVLLALRWFMVFQIIHYLISRDNYTRCHDIIGQKAQENARSVPDPSPRYGVGSGDETTLHIHQRR